MKKTKSKTREKRGGKTVDFSKHLRGLGRHLEKAKETAKEGGFEEFDDGRYKMKATDAKIGVSKNKRVQVIITWKFMSGEYKGKQKLDFEGLQEEHLPYLLKKLDAMGYDVAAMENLEEEIPEILSDIKKSKPECRVRLKTKGEFQNLYVDGPLSDDDGDDEEDEDEDEDDAPKKKSKKKSSKKDEEDEDEEEEDESDDEDEEESDDEDEDEEDEKPKKKGKTKKSSKKSKDDDEDEEEDEEEDDEDSDDEEDEDEDDEEEKPKSKKKSKSKKKDEDDEEDEDEEEEDESDDEEDADEEEDEIDIEVGSIVKADTKAGKVKGEIVELFEKEGKVLLKTEKGKTVKIKAEKILSVEEAPAKSVPSKKKKKTKK